MKKIATGNKAVAEAVKQIVPDVVAAYPITPQTEIVEQIAEFVTSGELKSRYIPVESEHSAMAACRAPSPTEEAMAVAVFEKALAWELMPNTVVPIRRKSSSRSLMTPDSRGRSRGMLRAHSSRTGLRASSGVCVSVVFSMNQSFS